MIESLIERIAELEPHWLLLLAFLLPLGETVALVDFLVPGELGLVVIGASARIAGVPIVLVIAVGSAGAFLGDSTSWFIGHRWGTALLTRWEPIRRHTEGPLAAAEDHFARYGGPTVFGARFVGPLRALVPLVAGTSGMAYRRFVPWNAAASVGWVTLVVTLGAVFGEPVAAALDRFGLVVTVVMVAVVFIVVARYRVRRRRAAADTPGDHH